MDSLQPLFTWPQKIWMLHALHKMWCNKQKNDHMMATMIIIAYGSILAPFSYNRAASVGCHGRQLRPIFADWLCQLPTLRSPRPSPFHVSAKVAILSDSLFLTFWMTSSSGLGGHRRTYLTILESADHALFKIVRYVLLRALRPELDGQAPFQTF
jgi:hypothetical protein